MARRNLPWIILFNILGIALFLSWYLPTNHGFWFPIDSSIFFFFNEHLATNRTFLYLVAYTNNRAFDAIALLSMGLLYLSFFVKRDGYGKRRMLILGVVILFTAVILNQLGHLLPVQPWHDAHHFCRIYASLFHRALFHHCIRDLRYFYPATHNDWCSLV